jgi:lipopolysaccharide/colanic/teichoic acid biosynthesis glycosyltransferase
MLLEMPSLLEACSRKDLGKILHVISESSRETDIAGWFKTGSTLGMIFTEVSISERVAVASALIARLTRALRQKLRPDQVNQVRISTHIFPEHSDEHGTGGPMDSTLYPEVREEAESKRVFRAIKRSLDVGGSFFALCVSSPVWIAVAIAIKITSPGPVLFRQQRIGEAGKRFTFLKFRSMYSANNHAIHEEYVKQLIAGKARAEPAGRTKRSVYKLTNDPRVTPLGRFLRRSSLDELPQLLNVLRGEMSLVGPRPPIPYEFACYDIWHKRRLLALKPGITGLWQVGGRSRVKFDEMVRLDLKYAQSWSPWLDIQVLLRTPGAVLLGEGAY